jgi:O-antigen ligase
LFGTGFESFWLGSRLEKLWSLYWWHPGQAHNGYLEVFLNLGWMGIALLAVILVAGYWAAFRAWRNGLPIGSLRLTYIFVGLVFNFTEAAFFRMQAPVWLFLLLAVTNVPAISYRSGPSARSLFQYPGAVGREHGQLIRCEEVV